MVLIEMESQPKSSGQHTRMLAYVWNHRREMAEGGPLHQKTIEDSFDCSGREVTVMRERAAYHSLRLVHDNKSDYCILVGTGLCTLSFVPMGDSLGRFRDLDELHKYERIGARGLESTATVMIYIHHGTGIARPLVKQMIANMRAGVRYQYFIPESCLRYLPQLLGELLRPFSRDLSGLLEVMKYNFEINVIPVRLPTLFSIHNANKESSAVMYVRFLTGRKLVRYCAKARAYERAQSMLREFPPVERGPKVPLIAKTGESWQLSDGQREQLAAGLSSEMKKLRADPTTIEMFCRRFVNGLSQRDVLAEKKYLSSSLPSD